MKGLLHSRVERVENDRQHHRNHDRAEEWFGYQLAEVKRHRRQNQQADDGCLLPRCVAHSRGH
jgi:hypothetical protein